jgi:hydrogenase/urease accessory protein HupE
VRHGRHWLMLASVLIFVFVLAVARPRLVCAHETRPAYLEIKETAPDQYELLWRTPVSAGMRMPVRLRLPSDLKDFKPPTNEELTDSLVERLWVTVPGGITKKRIEFLGLENTITDVVMHVELLDSQAFTTIVHPSRSWVEIPASETRGTVVADYLLHGIRHISLGADHLLFLLGLLLIVKNRWMLLKTVTAFTVAHSLTLALATLGYANAPIVPLNAAIALSILFLGPEIARSWRGQSSFTILHPWVVAFVFGLLHGFGFASALSTTGLPRSELLLALLSFNVGVELGQLGFVLLVLLLERAFRILEIRWPHWVEVVPGYTVGSLGAFWTVQRVLILFGVKQ